MFPIPWNKAYRKKDGGLVTIDEAMSGGGEGSIPPHSADDAGKVLGVSNDGTLAWVEVSGSNRYSAAALNFTNNSVNTNAEEVI